jgi:hypothetical protein
MPKVKRINHKAIFERAAGHPMDPPKRVIICSGPDKYTLGNKNV